MPIASSLGKKIDLNDEKLPKGRYFGIIHSGGPAPGSNAVIRGFVEGAAKYNIKVVAFEDGCRGLLGGKALILTPKLAQKMGERGGVDIGTARKNPSAEERKQIISNLKNWGIEAQGLTGGDDTLTTAGRLSQDGLTVVGMPKTIDDDVPGTAITYGILTVVRATAKALRALRRDARSVSSDNITWYLAEVMGRSSGSWTLNAALAAQLGIEELKLKDLIHNNNSPWKNKKELFPARMEGIFPIIREQFTLAGLQQISRLDFSGKEWMIGFLSRVLRVKGEIIPPEKLIASINGTSLGENDITLDASLLAKELVGIIKRRADRNKPYGIFAIAEGVADRLPTEAIREGGKVTGYKVLGMGKEVTIGVDAHNNPLLGDVKIAEALKKLIGTAAKEAGIKVKTDVSVLGRQYRCIDPVAADVKLCYELGFQAASLLAKGDSGKMVRVTEKGTIASTPFTELPKRPDGHLEPRVIKLSCVSFIRAANLAAQDA